jgi:hypothetical protein
MCVDDAAKDLCASLHQLDATTNSTIYGVCDTISDGYYTVGTGCFLMGFFIFFLFIRPGVAHIETLPERAWRLTKHSKE